MSTRKIHNPYAPPKRSGIIIANPYAPRPKRHKADKQLVEKRVGKSVSTPYELKLYLHDLNVGYTSRNDFIGMSPVGRNAVEIGEDIQSKTMRRFGFREPDQTTVFFGPRRTEGCKVVDAIHQKNKTPLDIKYVGALKCEKGQFVDVVKNGRRVRQRKPDKYYFALKTTEGQLSYMNSHAGEYICVGYMNTLAEKYIHKLGRFNKKHNYRLLRIDASYVFERLNQGYKVPKFGTRKIVEDRFYV